MYTKEQISKLRQQFWTAFGQYMKPVPGVNAEKVNWLNYKTGIRNIFFRMDADKEHAIVCVELRHSNEHERMQSYMQFISLRKLMEESTGYAWKWESATLDGNGQSISRIGQSINHVNVLNEKDWPAIIAFLKPRIMSLDVFWDLVKDGFE